LKWFNIPVHKDNLCGPTEPTLPTLPTLPVVPVAPVTMLPNLDLIGIKVNNINNVAGGRNFNHDGADNGPSYKVKLLGWVNKACW